MRTRTTRIGLLLGFIFCSAAALAGTKPPAKTKQDSAWRPYCNDTAGYCLNYPSRWLRNDAYEGTGLYLVTGIKRFTRPTGEIDMGVVEAQQPAEPVATIAGFDGYLADHFEEMRRFERAEKVAVAERREAQIAGMPALYSKYRYVDPMDNSAWTGEIALTRIGGKMFRFEMSCKADQVDRFEPLFQYFLQTFQLSNTERP